MLHSWFCLAYIYKLIAEGTYFALTYLILDFINSDSNGNTVMDPLAPHMSAYDCLPVLLIVHLECCTVRHRTGFLSDDM